MNAYVRMTKLKPNTNGKQWVVRIVDHPSDLHLHSPLQVSELHVVPQFSGGGGFVKIVIGIVIIAVAWYFAGPLGATFSNILLSVGASLVLGGLLELLTPAPKTTPATANTNSQYLGVAKNTTDINTPIPIGYGRFLVYGQILSFRLDANQGAVDGQAPTDSQRYVGNS